MEPERGRYTIVSVWSYLRSVRVAGAVVTLIALVALVAAGTAIAAQSNVAIVDDAFSPPAVTVNVGDSVVWTNAGESPHTATANDGSFNSGRLDPGATFAHTFTTPGTFSYRCEFHSDMVGQVVVQAAAAPANPAAPAPAAPAAGTGAGGGTAPAGGAPAAGAAGAAGTAATAPNSAFEYGTAGLPVVLLGVALVAWAASLAGRRLWGER